MSAFESVKSLGELPPKKIQEYLSLIDNHGAAAGLATTAGQGQSLSNFLGSQEPYLHTGILIGYIPVGMSGKNLQIQAGTGLTADNALKNQRIRITLDRFYVSKFPGLGTHSILCEFTGKNQISNGSEEIRFAISTEAKNNSTAAVSGAPIFLGLTVGSDGVAFEGRTINVSSKDDDMLMEALGSDTFKSGLSLLTSVQPALKPFVGLAGSVVKAILGRNKNKQIYNFKLGLDFGGGSTSVRLKEGSYIVVQGDSANWDWDNHTWNSNAGILQNTVTNEHVGLNYMVFGVSRFEGNPD